MNRVIKFRAWTEGHWINKGMVYDYQDMTYLESCGWDSFPIMQYTGLKDKNGKEIYEGDIIKERSRSSKPIEIIYEGKNLTAYEPIYHNAIVIFYKGSFCLHNEPTTESHERNSKYNGTTYYGCLQSAHFDIEVIGNIYESTHLLTP